MRSVNVLSAVPAARRNEHPQPRGRAAALLPPCFFASASLFFAVGLVAAPAVVGELGSYFYQARVLALTHVFTLGWISMAMLGVLYRYVPALTKGPLPYPRVAVAQSATFHVGVVLLIVSLWTGRWTPTACAAALLAGSAVLVGVNLWPLLARAPGRGVAEAGIALATIFLVAAATLATLIAIDKEHPFLPSGTLANLGAHAHLAAVGWVGVTICALSFRFLPAFLLPAIQTPDAARRQVMTLGAAVALLAAALLAESRFATLAAAGVALALVAYLVLLIRMVASHRLPIDWTTRHAMAGALWLLGSVVGGGVLAAIGAETAAGARLAAAYGVAGILGWMSNLVIGVSYKLFPGFVAAARVELGRRAVPVLELAVPAAAQAAIFGLYNAGVLTTVAGLLLAAGSVSLAGTGALAAAGVLYAGATARTLAFVLVDPRLPRTPLRIVA
jgi:hypothetical protein